MPEPVEDFWPKDLGVAAEITPVTVLKEQAALLGRRTHNLVEAVVRSSLEKGRFYHSLYLRVPTLGDYHYQVLWVSHPVEIYPLAISDEFTGRTVAAKDLDEFRERLREILSSDGNRSHPGGFILLRGCDVGHIRA